MKQKTLWAAVLVASTWMTPVAAQDRPGVIPPYEVLTIVRSTGLQPIGQPARRGANYLLRALDADGAEMRVVVDARLGEVVSITPVIPVRAYPQSPYGPPPGAIYVDPEPMPRGGFRSAPPAIYEPEQPLIYPENPAAHPRVIPAPNAAGNAGLQEPEVIMGPNSDGTLPPPPERFPQRVAPQPEPRAKPAERRTAAGPPAQPPLPKPRPAQQLPEAPASAPAVAPVRAAPEPGSGSAPPPQRIPN